MTIAAEPTYPSAPGPQVAARLEASSPGVRTELERSSALAAELLGAVDRLEARIGQALRPPTPAPGAPDSVAMTPGRCDLADELESRNGGLAHIIARLTDITDRVDL